MALQHTARAANGPSARRPLQSRKQTQSRRALAAVAPLAIAAETHVKNLQGEIFVGCCQVSRVLSGQGFASLCPSKWRC